ncbi:hypothetical protein LCGC14_0561770 [marine sediment metagenome]|uniref:Uncharacterized protein n=1 Tax=marine sediment metagenome TaxID=412755 RepID=A0A0F9RLP4_9ZZZZ
MSLYGSFKYGTDVKYGVGVTTGNLLWSFIVLWDGVWWSPNEAYRRMTNLTVKRGRQNMLAAGGGGLESFGVGEVVGIFDNEDGRFDPFNIDSPLYPNVSPGKFVRIAVRDDSTGTDYGVMRGIIADIQPIRQGTKDTVRIVVRDGLQWLKDKVVNLGLQQNVFKDTIFLILTAKADWPDEWPRGFGVDAANHIYYWAWNQGGYEAMDEWNRAEWAVTFHSRGGNLLWFPRTYSQINTYNISQDELLTDIGRSLPWENVRTTVKTLASPMILDTINDILWQLQTVPAILDGATFFIEPIFKWQEWRPAGFNITFGFTVNAQADGGGADLSGDCVLVNDSDIGDGARLWLTNNSGTDGFITDFRATGDAIYAPSEDIRVVEDAAAQAEFGSRTLVNTSRWVADTEYAQTLSAWLLDNLKAPNTFPVIQMEDRLLNQFGPDLYDKIILRVPKLKLRKVFRVGNIEHQWLSENGQGVKTTMQLESYLIEDIETRDEIHNGCLLSHTGAQSIPNDTNTDIDFAQELFDRGGYHTGAGGDIVIPLGLEGYYRILISVRWEANATGQRIILLRRSGTTLASATQVPPVSVPPVAIDLTQHLEITLYVAAADSLSVSVYQNSGGALDIEHEDTPYTPLFGAQFLGA